MCLLLLAYRAHPDTSVLLAGNRDEFFRRPARPPTVIAEHPRIHAGQDLEAGGTWMGRNEHGLVAALTNRHAAGRPVPPDVRSRGEIVLRLLEHADADAAAQWLAAQPARRYRPFNVLFGTPEAFYFFASEEPGAPVALQPGFHALSNSTLNDTSWPKVARSHRFLADTRALPGEVMLARLQAFLCDPTPPDAEESPEREVEVHGALGAVFIDTPGYGTVSSSIITVGGALGDRYYFAERDDMLRAQHAGAEHAPPFRRIPLDEAS